VARAFDLRFRHGIRWHCWHGRCRDSVRGIGMSVVVLGLAIAFQLSVPTLAAMALVGFFAIFHGYAHGAEMPESVSGLSYGLGFVCATALLHAAGVGLGIAIGKTGQIYSHHIAQIGGAAMAIAGVAIVISS